MVADGRETTVVSGGSCPKYDEAGAAGRKLPKDAPQPFREREELLRGLLDEETVGGPLAGVRSACPSCTT